MLGIERVDVQSVYKCHVGSYIWTNDGVPSEIAHQVQISRPPFSVPASQLHVPFPQYIHKVVSREEPYCTPRNRQVGRLIQPP